MCGRPPGWVPFALAAATFLPMLGQREFATSHEARVAQTARVMAAAGWPWAAQPVETPRVHLVKRLSGLRLAADPAAPPMHVNPWIVPILDQQIRLQKPPLPYWCAAAMFELFGVGEAEARLVPALLGALATLLVFDLGRLLYGRRTGMLAAGIWATTYLIPDEYRMAMADPYLAFTTLAAVWAWMRAGAPVRGRHAHGSMLHLLLFYVAMGLGALAKGPLVFLHVAVPLVLYHACFRAARLPRGAIVHGVGILLFVGLALPWPLAVLRQVPNAMQLWRYESVGEMSGENQENLRNWTYYFHAAPQLALPWVALWIWSLAYPLRRHVRRRRAMFPLLWYVAILLIFTMVGQKKNPYLLPMMPAQVLMIAVAARPILRLARRTRMRGLAGALIGAQALIGIAFAAALPALAWQDAAERWMALAASGGAIVLALLPLRPMFRARPAWWMMAQAVAYAAALIVLSRFYVTPVLTNARSPKLLCRELTAMADGTHRAILVSRLPEEAAFYLPLHPPTGAAPSEYLTIVDDQKGVADRQHRHNAPEPPLPEPAEFQDALPDAKIVGVQRVLMPGASGDARYKVYALRVERTGLASR